MELMFTLTQYLKKSISLINEMDSVKFSPFLLRIVQINLKDETSFTAVELEKLHKTLNMSATEVDDVIGSCEFIYQQVAYHAAKPAVLEEQLRRIGLNDDKVVIMVDTWKNCASEVISGLRQHTLPPAQLSSVNWRLCLTMSQKHASTMKVPTATLQLNVRQQTAENERIVMELSRSELYKLYNQLELIQTQLDGLRG